MTSTYLFYLFEIICLNTLLKFLSFVHVTSKLSILFNHAEHLKGLMPCYTLLSFTIIQGKDHLVQRSRASKAPTSPSSHSSNYKNQDHKDLLGSNKPSAKSFKAPIGLS